MGHARSNLAFKISNETISDGKIHNSLCEILEMKKST